VIPVRPNGCAFLGKTERKIFTQPQRKQRKQRKLRSVLWFLCFLNVRRFSCQNARSIIRNGIIPFGEAQASTTETVPNRIRFAGRELEGASGLYYNNARWYDPQLHRFISEDPIGIAAG